MEPGTIQKIATMCSMEPEQVISVHDGPTTYHVPLLLEKQNLLKILTEHLDLHLHLEKQSIAKMFNEPLEPPSDEPAERIKRGERVWSDWVNLVRSQEIFTDKVSIAIVGKYTANKNAYLSVTKALEHAAMHCRKKIEISWIDAAHLEDETQENWPAKYHKAWHDLCAIQGVVVPGGFGARSTEGIIKAITWARTNKKPFLGVSLGMQLAVIEYARNVMGIIDAGSEEFHPESKSHLIIGMSAISQGRPNSYMRLGKHACVLQQGTEWSKLRCLYGSGVLQIEERHRNQYEINPDMIEKINNSGLSIIGKDVTGKRVEIVEIRHHPFFVGVQFHPEYLSRVSEPSKVFLGFFAAAAGCLEKITTALQQGQRSFADDD